MLPFISPRVGTDTLKSTPQLFALSSVFTRIWNARWFTVLYNFAQMHAHVAVDVQDFFVYHQATEAADETLVDRRS